MKITITIRKNTIEPLNYSVPNYREANNNSNNVANFRERKNTLNSHTKQKIK